jgi:diguanylate cyclase (GGDEF)-like protein
MIEKEIWIRYIYLHWRHVLESRLGLLNKVRQQLENKDIPSETRDNLVGLLSAIMTTISPTTSTDESLFLRLADAFSENSNLLVLIQQQAAELDALKRIAFNLTSSLELQDVLNGVVQEALRLVDDANDAHIFLYQNEKITFGASLTVDGRKNEQYGEPRPDGLTYKVALSREMIMIENMREHSLYKDAPHLWSGSIIGIPLKMGTRVLGVMNLARTRTGEFSQAEIRLLSLLADQAAIAIINARLHQAVSQQARSDALTTLPNRRALDERLEEEIKRSSLLRLSFSVVMMDIDGFKKINDTYGHDIGDDILRITAQAMTDSLRSSDFLARYGGDEMTLVLPDTDLPQAAFVTRKLQNELFELSIPLPDGQVTAISVSGGIALFPKHAGTPAGLLRAADEALYKAKKYARGTFLAARGPTSELEAPKPFNPRT